VADGVGHPAAELVGGRVAGGAARGAAVAPVAATQGSDLHLRLDRAPSPRPTVLAPGHRNAIGVTQGYLYFCSLARRCDVETPRGP
jgi:hypothetical protein